jgi:hypothetical protein
MKFWTRFEGYMGRYGLEHKSTMRMFMDTVEEEVSKGSLFHQWCRSISNRPNFSIRLGIQTHQYLAHNSPASISSIWFW